MTHCSLILPCYNEAPNLPEVVSRAVACARRRGWTPEQFQLVLVENGSTDASRQVLHDLGKGPDAAFLRVVLVDRNCGYGHGVFMGLRAAPPGLLAWSHADQQCDPEDAFVAFELLLRTPGRVLVKGRRQGRALPERFVSRTFELAARAALGQAIGEINAQPKVFRSELLGVLTEPPDDFAFDLYVLHRALQAGYTIREITVQFPPRVHGTSNWSSTLRSRARTMARMLRYIDSLRRRRT